MCLYCSERICAHIISVEQGEDWSPGVSAYVRYVPERTCRDDGRGVFRCTECGAFVKRSAVMDCVGDVPIRYCPNCGAKVVSE